MKRLIFFTFFKDLIAQTLRIRDGEWMRAICHLSREERSKISKLLDGVKLAKRGIM